MRMTCAPTLEDLLHARTTLRSRGYVLPMVVWAGIAMGIAGSLMLFAAHPSAAGVVTLIIFAIMAVALIIQQMNASASIRRELEAELERNGFLLAPCEVELTESGLDHRSSLGELHVPWSAFEGYYETPVGVLLIEKQNYLRQVHLLLKRNMAEQGGEGAWMAFLGKHLRPCSPVV